MPTHDPIAIAATGVGIGLSGVFVGLGYTLSYLAVPGILLPKPKSDSSSQLESIPASSLDLIARQYRLLYAIGSRDGPIFALLAAASYLTTYRYLPVEANLSRQLLIAAAASVVSVAPYTMIVMKRTNGELHRRAYAADAGKDEREGRKGAREGSVESYETVPLLKWWAFLNMSRAMIAVASAACAITAIAI